MSAKLIFVKYKMRYQNKNGGDIMGVTIVMPSLKLNDVGLSNKHCGNFKSVAEEALKERKGRDADIDSTKSSDNITKGFQTAALIADTDDIGFEKFHEFVATNKTIIGSLCFSQNGNVFTVSLINEDTGKSKMLFESYEADISESYRLVLFVIQHCYMDRDTYSADNFIVKDAVIK